MLRTRTALVGVGAAAAVLVAGCGSQTATTKPLGGTPGQQIRTATTNLLQGDTLTARLHLGANARSLLTFESRVAGHADAKHAAFLAGAAVTMTVHSTSGSLADAAKQADAAAEQTDLVFTDQGTRYAELRDVDQNLYLQANVKGIIQALGEPLSSYNQALAQAKHLPAGATALLTGRWVEGKGSDLKAFAKRYSKAAGQPFPSLTKSQRSQFLSRLENLFTKDVKVRRTGTTASATSYALTANTRQLAETFLSSLTVLQPALSGQLHRLPFAQIPSRSITFKAQVSDNKLSQVSFDFAQLARGKSAPRLPLELDFSTASQSISAPSGATVLDLAKLIQTLGQASVSGGSATSATATLSPGA